MIAKLAVGQLEFRPVWGPRQPSPRCTQLCTLDFTERKLKNQYPDSCWVGGHHLESSRRRKQSRNDSDVDNAIYRDRSDISEYVKSDMIGTNYHKTSLIYYHL